MFHFSSKNVLSGSDSLDLTEILLKNAQDSEKPTTKLALCGYVDELLGHMKKFVKRPSPSTAHNGSSITKAQGTDDGQSMRERIARAYLEHAKLMADLGHPDMAQESRRRADKWGGPGTKVATSLPAEKGNSVTALATVSDSIFPDDYLPFSSTWSFPKPDGRVEDTPQLVSCLGLLKQAPEDLPEDALDPVARTWLKATNNNPDEKTRLDVLASDLIRAFTQDEIKDEKAIAEVLCLVPVLSKEYFRILLNQFLGNLNDSQILNFGALRGVAQLLQSATPGYLSSQDLIDVLGPMSTKLQDTHAQSPDHIFELTVAVSRVLDAMADAKVTGLKRVDMHEPLLAFLGGLRGSDDPHTKFYASYAFQALLCVPDDESRWQATVRRTTKVVKGISGLVSAVKGLDLNAFMDGLQNIQEGFDGIQQLFELGKTAYEGVSAVYESEQDLVASLKEAFKLNRRSAWYSALRGADTLIDGGELFKFKVLVCGAVCRRDVEFQWGVCQRLGSVAANPHWNMETRQGALRFLEEIYRNDLVWGPLPPIKAYILDILKHLSLKPIGLPDVVLLLENLATDGDPTKQDIYRSCATAEPSQYSPASGVLEFASPSLIDRVQKRTDVETDLRRIFRSRVTERGGSVYVPPMAKSSVQASDETIFELIPVVDEFLKGDQQKVLLLLGDSGVGKTTFNRELDLKLWKAYQARTGRIPLLISLPGIDRPEKDLIAKHLRLCEFNESQIRELKEREFVIICDGYDESQQTHNLYETNGLNKDGGWKAQMIVSCRSEHIGQDYRDLFQPARLSPSDPDLLLQAVLVPFSMDQVKQYIAAYVTIKRPLWEASDYEGILDQIPSLQELVKNPFLLTLSLEVLPRLADPGQKLTTNKITRVQLYDEFVAQWLERNKKRLGSQELNDQEKEAFESLSDDGFTLQGLVYLRDLAAAIYHEQNGSPVVDYSKARDIQTWKEKFFGRKDNEIRLLRKALPLTRNGSRFGFIHRSILEYGISRAIYEPQKRSGIKLETEPTDKKKKNRFSTGSAMSFEIKEVPAETADQGVQGPNADSPLVNRSFVKDTSVVQFLAERVEQESVFKDQLVKYLEASKTDKKWRTAAANAITILIRANVRFSHQDLRKIQVPGADLSFGVFEGALLQEADLRKVSLQNAWIRQADLSNARLERAQFGEWPTLSEDKMSEVFAYTPDGNTFIAGTKEGKILLYYTSTWAIRATLEGHDKSITSLVVSKDGTYLASGADDREGEMAARIWKIETGECLQILPGHTQRFTGLIFLHGNRFITGSCSKSVQMWQLETGARLFTFEVEESEAGVEAIACSPDGRLLATSYQDRSLRVWDIGSQKCLYALNDQPPWICQLLFSPDSKYLTSYSDVIMVRDVETGADVWTFKGFMEPMCLVAYSPDGQQLACSMADSLIKVLDAATGEVILTLRGHSQSVYRIVYSSDGLQIATGSQDRTVRLFDSQTGTPGPIFQGHTNTVLGLQFSNDNHQIASGGWDETVRLWDTGASTMVESRRQRQSHFYPTETFFLPSESPYVISRCQEWLKLWERESGQFVRSLRIEGLHMSVLAVSPSGLEVATAGNGETIQLWNVELGKAGLALDSGTHNLFRRSVVYSPNGILLASTGGMGGRSVKVWNCRTGALVNEWTGSCEVMSLTFSKTGGQLAVCNEDFTVKLLDMFTGLCVSTLTTMGAQGPPTSHAFAAMYSSDQTEIVATFNDGTAHTWDLISGKLLRKVDAGRIVNAGYPNPYLFSPGGRLFFVFSGVLNSTSEGILQIWDTVKGELVWTIGDDETHSIRTTQALSSDQKWLVSTGSDDVIHLWDMETGQEVAKTEKLAYSCYSLAVEGTIAPAGTGKVVPGGRDTGLSLVIGLWNGSIIYWKLMEQDSVTSTGAPPSVEGVVVETQESTAKHNKGGDKAVEGVKKADYKFLMQWTSDFGKLNAQGAKIDGAQKLNRANTLLLKQNGAVGEVAPTVGFRHAVTKVMSSKNFLARLGTKQEENKEKETKVDPVRVGAIVVKENGEVVGGGCVNGEDPESSAMVARIEE